MLALVIYVVVTLAICFATGVLKGRDRWSIMGSMGPIFAVGWPAFLPMALVVGPLFLLWELGERVGRRTLR